MTVGGKFVFTNGKFNIYTKKQRWVGGLSNVYVNMLKDSFYLLILFTIGSQVVKNGQNYVYVNIVWPLTHLSAQLLKVWGYLIQVEDIKRLQTPYKVFGKEITKFQQSLGMSDLG